MTRFRMDNTEGYQKPELDEMNRAFDAIVAACPVSSDTKSWQDHLAERVQIYSVLSGTEGTMTETEQAIGRDLDLCDLGMTLTSGTVRRRYARHRKACFAEIRKMNKADGLDAMSDDELLAELNKR